MGIETNPGPTGETTAKLAKYQMWACELSQWMIPYCEQCELTLTGRIQLLLSFLDPTADATFGIIPMASRIMALDAPALKQHYYSHQEHITQK